MSCGGNMMRASFQPLAHLVDAAAEQWLAVADAPEAERVAVRANIKRSFHLGERPKMTFHGLRYLLSIERSAGPDECAIDVHEIVQNG